MSYISIVRGKITETTGGSDVTYAKNITCDARGINSQVGVKKGVLYAKNPKSAPSNTRAKCVVEYRPCKSWKGEFGIDWPRKADSKMAVDNNYKGIIGKYGKIYAPDKGAVFTPDNKAYLKHLNEYSTFNSYKGKYYVPNMTLMQGETAFLDAITEVKESPDKLHYSHDESIFEVIILKKLTSTKGKHFDERAVSIKCLKTFSQKQTIRIIATIGPYLEKVGEICILPNNVVKNVNVIFIPVIYGSIKGTKKGNEIQITKNALRQAYINPNITISPKSITVDGWWFDWFFTHKAKDGTTKLNTSKSQSLHRYLDKKFFEDNANQIYKNHYRVYMLPDSDTLNGAAEDVGNNAKVVVVFKNRNDSTSPHELMHAMGLYHTFDNSGLYTYKYQNTDNIMDYTHQIGKSRFSVNRWQWKILNPQVL